MLFEPRRRDAILGRRLAGLGGSGALHTAVIVSMLGNPVRGPRPDLQAAPPSADDAPIAVFQAVPETAAAAESLSRRPVLELAGIRVDLDKVGGTPPKLFPFVQLDPLSIAGVVNREHGTRRLQNPLVQGGSALPPLQMSDRELQALVDRAWSRRARWQPFAPIMDLVEGRDGDHGRAADLLRAYVDQNLLQPYYDGDTLDARYWTMLGLAADHRTFLDRVTAYLREQPDTRVATELRFLLDELVQGGRDTLLMVIGNDPAAALRRTAAEQPAAHARAEALFDETRAWLTALGLGEADALRRRLDEVRLHILGTILERTPDGYRAADASYLIGVIYFEQRQRDRAVAAWTNAMAGPHDLYSAALDDLRAALQLPSERRVSALVAALGAEHGRWLSFSERRLRHFGFQATQF